jgi:hypothetical protein
VLSPDGQFVAYYRAVGDDGDPLDVVTLRKGDTGEVLGNFAMDGGITLRKTDTGEVLGNLACSGALHSAPRFSPSGHLLAVVTNVIAKESAPSGFRGTRTPVAWLWDLRSEKLVGQFEGVSQVEFLPGDECLLLHWRGAGWAPTVAGFDLDTQAETWRSPLDAGELVQFFAGGMERSWFVLQRKSVVGVNRYLYWLNQHLKLGSITGARHACTVHDPQTGAVVAKFNGIATLSAAGDVIAIYDADSRSGTVRLYDLPARRSWWRMLATALAISLIVANGQLLLTRFLAWVRRK